MHFSSAESASCTTMVQSELLLNLKNIRNAKFWELKEYRRIYKVLNFNRCSMDLPPTSLNQPLPQKSTYGLVALSLLLHVFLIILLLNVNVVSPKKGLEQPTPPPLKAHLYFEPKSKVSMPQTGPLPVSSTVNETPKKVGVSENSEEVGVSDNYEEGGGAMGMLQRHVQSINQQRLEQTAKRATSSYRRRLKSPELPKASGESSLTPDEQLVQDISIKVDCSSSGKKTLKMVLGLFGGAVTCSSAPDIQPFLDQRLQQTGAKARETQDSSD